MNPTRITMDGETYRVLVVYNSMERAFELREGPNAGDMLSDRHERDLLGTKFSYQLDVEPDPEFPDDYDAFFCAISAPLDSHLITLPFGQSTITFDAMIERGRDRYKGKLAGKQRWGGLSVSFVPIAPQRSPT